VSDAKVVNTAAAAAAAACHGSLYNFT